MVDFERDQSCGFQGIFFENDGVPGFLAIVFDRMSEKGSPLLTPSLVKKGRSTGQDICAGEEDLYKTRDRELHGRHVGPDGVLHERDGPSSPLSSLHSRRVFAAASATEKDTEESCAFMNFSNSASCALQANHEESVKYHEELTAGAEIMRETRHPVSCCRELRRNLGLGQVKIRY